MNRASFVMPPQATGVTGPFDEPISETMQKSNQQLRPQAKLIIEEPRLSDEALYKCDVTYVKGKCPSISLVRVQMLALPEKAKLFQVNQGNNQVPLHDGQLIGPLNEHLQLQLKCSVSGGRPAPTAVFWRKIDSNGRTVNLKQPVSLASAPAKNSVDVFLNHTLTNLDLGAKFECHIEHEAIERTWARVVTVGEKLAVDSTPDAMLDLHPADQLDSNAAETTRMATMTSKSLDSHVLVDLNVGISSLDLFLAKVDGESKNLPYANEIQGKRNANDSLIEGDLIEVECVAYNSKPAANITWLHGQDVIGGDAGEITSTTTQTPLGLYGKPHLKWPQRHKRLLQRNQVQLNLDGQTFNTHSFLSIKLSRNEHRAKITCQAQNAPMTKPLTRSMELQVQHAPIVLMEPAAGIVTNEIVDPFSQPRDENVISTSIQRQPASPGVQRPGEVSIYCIYSAFPSQLVAASATPGGDQNSITRWFKDGQPIPGSTIVPIELAQPNDHLIESTTATGYPVLTIRHPNRRDAGRYDCQVSNAIGSSERLPSSESCKVEVNFRPSVQLSLFRVVDENKLRMGKNDHYKLDELVEVDLEKELVLPGAHFVLICTIVEAQPPKINKFHWYTTATTSPGRYQVAGNGVPSSKQQQQQTLGVSTDSEQFKLSAMGANFAPSSFACAASNAIGESGQSNQIDLQLSYAPGQSIVRPVSDALTRKLILASGRPAHLASSPATAANKDDQQRQQQIRPPQQAPLNAGAELLLECVTQELGQPKANIWLWFRNGQTVESIPFQVNSQQQQSQLLIPPTSGESQPILGGQDNPISEAGLSPPPPPTSDILDGENTRIVRSNGRRQTKEENEEKEEEAQAQTDDNTKKVRDQEASKEGNRNDNQLKARSLASGRYLFIPSIQLAHKGNYSCVAVNRLGSGPSAPNQSSNERDSYQVRVALAPSFVQPLASRTYWSETQAKPTNTSVASSSPWIGPVSGTKTIPAIQDNQQLDLVCHVQCEPICQIDWLRNNEPLDLKRQSESPLGNYVSHQVRQTLMDENDATNQFRSIESRLTLQFHDIRPSSGDVPSSDQDKRLLMIDRERILERRQLLNGANYTCQSSSNSMGPAVKSTTKFIVQYPPENVLINTPSDKLNLVEGSNGPRLSCEASGEPRVQFRWLLLRSNNNVITSSDLVASRYQVKHFKLPVAGSTRRQVQSPPLEAIHQLAGSIDNNNKQHQIGPDSETTTTTTTNAKSPNDIGGQVDSGAEADSSRLVELTGASSEQVGGTSSSSILDLSDISIDRKQSGHYICEASNRLGQTRQSVYVNVLYKPTCTTLHLHSLDMIQPFVGPFKSTNSNTNNNEPDNEINQSSVRPFRATNNDEYSMVRETSQDFIGLRKILIMSPMLNRQQQQQQQLSTNEQDELSFKGSIFQTILEDKRELKDKDALLHDDNHLDNNLNLNQRHQNSLFVSNQSRLIDLKQNLRSNTGDSWDKFNSLLLTYLNNYMKQVKLNEEHSSSLEQSKRQNRRSSLARNEPGESNVPNVASYEPSTSNVNQNDANYNVLIANSIPGDKNFLTFACLAQDGNPMNNLSFDWTFNSVSLPETEPIRVPTSAANNHQDDDLESMLAADSKPVLIYSNENSTLNIQLVRRLDTRTTLNPFQLSLLTLNVIVSNQANREARQSDQIRPTRQTSQPQRAPVIKNRYQSFYNNIKANQHAAIRVAHEFDAIKLPSHLELNEHNWQQQLGLLLKCSVSNQIGTSNSCPAAINLQERLKSQASSSLYEFARWRMPSLAQKSLLIIGLMVSCMLVLFATFALLAGPYLKSLQLVTGGLVVGKRPDSGQSKDDGTNTGQSTSSQKSSVLGLLGNGDSSFQGSSDDDSTGRLNHMDNATMSAQRADLNLVVASGHSNEDNFANNANLDRRSMMNYDQPATRMIYQPGNLNEQLSSPGQLLTSAAYANHYDQQLTSSANCTGELAQATDCTSTSRLGAASGRLLASLRFKSLSKFKVDRIADLPSITGRLNVAGPSLHAKNISNSETTTTGLSINALDTAGQSSQLSQVVAGHLRNHFGPPNLRHSHHFGRQAPPAPVPNYFMYREAQVDEQLMQLNNNNTVYSNMQTMNEEPLNAMDEFLKRRGLQTPTGPQFGRDMDAYSSKSLRNRASAISYSLQQQQQQQNNDLSQYKPRVKPPVHPRTTHMNPSATMYRPTEVVRTSQHLFSPSTLGQAALNHGQYQQSYANNSFGQTTNRLDTIDTHLDRQLAIDNMALGYHPYTGNQMLTSGHQMGYANTLELNSNRYHQHNLYDDSQLMASSQNQSAEHIYDVNAYATPEQTPLRRPNSIHNGQQQARMPTESETPRVSQLIQSFNSQLSD